MRRTFTLLVGLVMFSVSAWAQPANDNCADAINISLGNVPSCPTSGSSTATVSGTTIDATPVSPYPLFVQCPTQVANEVWYSFQSPATAFEIELSSGFNAPIIVLYEGDDCNFLTAVDCFQSNNGNIIDARNLVPGETYYLMVSGGDVNDNADFTLTITSSNICGECIEIAPNITASPPPINGTYSSGTTVNFCYNVEQWAVTGSIQWLHAITIEFGAGWDYDNSFTPFPPPSCGGDGTWGWYESWTGCRTGQLFERGFAYDSASGLGCGGTPNDGDPGNNWGDGLFGCSSIPDQGPPKNFCWSIQVNEFAGCEASFSTDLSIRVNLYQDGVSGSYGGDICTIGDPSDAFATAICCSNELPPLLEADETSCPGASDGAIRVTGTTNDNDPNAVFNIFVFDAAGNVVFQGNGIIGQIEVPNLPAGTYTAQTVNVATGCPGPSESIDVFDAFPPFATAIANPPLTCPGSSFNLMGMLDDPSQEPFATWNWTGPGGPYSGQNITVTQEGTYTLNASVDGCPADPFDITVEFEDITVSAETLTPEVCENGTATIFANGDPSFDYDWGIYGNGAQVNVPNLTTTTTFTVTATNPASGCTATDDVTVVVNPLPDVQAFATGPLCAGTPFVVTATGANIYNWDDGQTGPVALFTLGQGLTTVFVTGTDGNGCSRTIPVDLNISAPPTAAITPDNPESCGGEDVTLTASGGINYAWSTNENTASITVSPTVTTTYMVTVTDFNGCEAETATTVIVDQPVSIPDITCGTATPSSVTFNWGVDPNASGYIVNVLSGQTNGVPGNGTFFIDNLSPGEEVQIQVIAESGNTCPDATATFSCFAESCPNVSISIDNAPTSICLTGSLPTINLNTTVTGGNGTGTYAWTGPNLTNTTSATATFDPEAAGPGTYTFNVTYTELGFCDFTAQATINVFDTPTSVFTLAPAPICINGSSTVTYTGTATPGATYNWNFAGGTATPGTGQGPHTVEWTTPGTKTVSLTVVENGCLSTPTTRNVVVESELPAPVVSCGTTTTNSVQFVWNDIPGADGFSVNVTTGQTGTQSGNAFTVSGLTPGEAVTIQVTAQDNGPCPDQTTTFTCSAASCPTFTIDLSTPQNDICLNGSNTAFDLSATVSGGAGNGTGTWSGPGITNATNGTFNPAIAGAGAHVITYNYAEGACTGSNTLTINVFDTPTASFNIADASICITGSTVLTYTGTASAGATYNWNFGGGTASPSTGQGPHTVSWATPGTKTISLSVTENGCTSALVTQTIEVEAELPAPMVRCGTITTTSVEFLWDAIAGADDFTISVTTGQTGIQSGNSYTVSNLSPGEAVTIVVTAVDNGPCDNTSTTFTCTATDCPSFTINLTTPQNDICLDGSNTSFDLSATVTGGAGGGSGTWSGNGITDATAGTFDPATAGEGSHTITYNYAEGPCTGSNSIVIDVFDTPTANFTVAPATICITGNTTVTYTGDVDVANTTFTWNFGGGMAMPGTGAGPHNVSWTTGGTKTITLFVTENGCTSPVFSQNVEVDEPLAPPVINCSTTTSSITFTWEDVTGATSYNVTVLQGASGTQMGNSYEVTGLSPGDLVEIQVEAVGTGPCGNSTASLECVAEDCPNVSITLPMIDPICLDATATTIDLDATITGGAGGGTETWSGPGITDAAMGIFNPTTAGPGNHIISINYQEGNCSYNQSLTITVFEQPTADFTATSPICITGTSTIIYTGTASAGATYDWDFDGGVAVPGTGPGPHEVSWTTSGSKTIELIVTENGCASDPFTASVQVDEELALPVINCMSSTTEITFSWADVPNATGYTVQVLSGQSGVEMGNSITIAGLMPGEEVTVRVTAIGDGACGDVFAEQTCTAQDCPMVTLDITPVDDICLDATTGVVDLEATITGGAGGGTETWSGTGITDAAQGIFDPNVAGEGSHTITLTYEENNCSYSNTTTINVIIPPTADFTATSPICLDGDASVAYTGTASASATFTWDFDGGVGTPGTGIGPHAVSWTTPGDKTIMLTVEENGCTSQSFTQVVTVEAPIEAPFISCESTNTSINFVWNTIDGASDYEVTLLAGAMGMSTSDTTYFVDGLSPGDSVRIRVTAIDGGPCDNTETVLTCFAQDCPAISVAIDPIADLCTDSGIQTLNAMVTGGDGTGTLVWSGSGIVDATAGTFDPSMVLGTVSVNATYTQGVCSYSDSRTVLVNAVPTADFTAGGPVCIDQNLTLTYTGTASDTATYNWDFDGGMAVPGTGVGPHEVSWATSGTKTITLTVEENGCLSAPFTQVVEVEQPLEVPFISCESTNTSINFVWNNIDGAADYEVTLLAGAMGTSTSDTTYFVDGLNPGDSVRIRVTAIDNGPCGNTEAVLTCFAQDCPAVSVAIDPVADLCTDSGIQTLNAVVTGGDGTGTLTWSGSGIVDATAGTFDPSGVSGMVTVNVSYIQGVCNYSASQMILINEVPTADFNADAVVCTDQSSTLTYTGTASAAATYTWDFDGGVAIPGTGPGPHEVSWDTPGAKTIILTVEENGCVSPDFDVMVGVLMPLEAPVISCATTNTSITFSWEDIDGASGYDVEVLDGPTGVVNGTSYEVTGLDPGTNVTIRVTALDAGPCEDVSAEATCIAADCPDVTVAIADPGSLCADAGIQTLTATPTGGVGGGTFTWQGVGIVDPALGTFDPSLVSGMTTISVTYTEGVCTYTGSLSISVNALPVASFAATSPVCVDSVSTITFDGTAGATATYTWDFDGGVAAPGTGAGPQEVSWDTPGTKTIALTVEENGCSSAVFEAIVEVEAPLAEPVINCEETTSTSILFSWEDVPGATGYEVVDLSGFTGTIDGNTYFLDGLTPNQMVTIQVIALGDGPCGNSMGEQTCVAQDCPSLTVTLSAPDEICSGISDDPGLTFAINASTDGPFTAEYTLNNGDVQSVVVNADETITLPGFSETTTVEVLNITDNSLTDCTYSINQSLTITVNDPVSAGVALETAQLCEGEANAFDLLALLDAPDAGGQWVETSASPSIGGAFDAATGSFNTDGQASGTYTFEYQVAGAGSCPADAATVEIEVVASPEADAGDDQTLTCNMGMVSIGSSASSGGEVTYAWSSDNLEAVISDPTSQIIDVSQAGTYTLIVTNTLGCTATDEVVVGVNTDVPMAAVDFSNISCFGANDGAITITNPTGGSGIYEYSFDGGLTFGQSTQSVNLGPGEYQVVIRDSNGCFSESVEEILEPDAISVSLRTDIMDNGDEITLGDTVILSAVFAETLNIDTIIWNPFGVAIGNEESIFVNPTTTTDFTVTIIDENGCTDSDGMRVFVRKELPVYIPNVFSPNDDGFNDYFYIQGGEFIDKIEKFVVFNRWGEVMIELNDIDPNVETLGWDGTFRGQALNSAVFTFFANIRFDDGEVVQYKGDVTLMR